MTMNDGIMFCEACGTLKAKLQFSETERQRWAYDAEKSCTCLRYAAKKQAIRSYPHGQCSRRRLASSFHANEHLHIPDDSDAPATTCYQCMRLNEH